MDNIKRYDSQDISSLFDGDNLDIQCYDDMCNEPDGEWCRSEDVTELENKIKELTEKLIKSNKDYCPERIGYEVGYKYVHEHCNGLDCDKCTRDQIDKGLNKG